MDATFILFFIVSFHSKNTMDATFILFFIVSFHSKKPMAATFSNKNLKSVI